MIGLSRSLYEIIFTHWHGHVSFHFLLQQDFSYIFWSWQKMIFSQSQTKKTLDSLKIIY